MPNTKFTGGKNRVEIDGKVYPLRKFRVEKDINSQPIFRADEYEVQPSGSIPIPVPKGPRKYQGEMVTGETYTLKLAIEGHPEIDGLNEPAPRRFSSVSFEGDKIEVTLSDAIALLKGITDETTTIEVVSNNGEITYK